MKTFLWTTLFWIIVAIAGLLCLGFGNLWTQVLDNDWLAGIMPKNLQSKICDYDWVVASTLESIDRCAAAQDYNCTTTVIETGDAENLPEDTAWMQEALSTVLANQETMYNEMMASFTSLNAKIDWVNNVAYEDGWETQSIESIIESLQIDLNNAVAEERYEDAANIRDQLRQLGQ